MRNGLHFRADPVSIAPREMVEIECAAPDDELLLVDWLNAVLYEMAARPCKRWPSTETWNRPKHMPRLGRSGRPPKHELGVEIKGATYADLHGARKPGGTMASSFAST